MKKIALALIAAIPFSVMIFVTAFQSGCVSTPTASSIVTPQALQIAAENGTYLALQKQPQLLQPLEAVVTGITNATAGGTFQFTGAGLTGTLNQLGFGGLANQPGAALLMDDLSAATALYDQQQGTNSIWSNTNIVVALNAVAAGINRGIQIYKQ